MTFEDAWQQALRGDFAALRDRRAQWPPHQSLAAAVLFSLVSEEALPTPRALGEVGSRLGLTYRALAAFLELDRAALAGCQAELQTLAGASAEAFLNQRWCLLLDGTAFSQGTPELRPEQRLLAMSQDSLNQLEVGDLKTATTTARRVNRMARSDGLVLHEYLAALVLARVRRHAGRPHLSIRILHALDTVAPPRWQGFLGWEQALVRTPASHAFRWVMTHALAQVFAAAKAGDRNAFAVAALDPSVPSLFAREWRAVKTALDPFSELAPGEFPFLRGEAGQQAGPLSGLTVSSVDQEGGERSQVFMLGSGARSRRVLADGLALLKNTDTTVLDSPYRITQAKPYVLLAELACAGPDGLDKEEAYRRVYGFKFVSERHGSVFRMLVSRSRDLLPKPDALERHGERLALSGEAVIAFPDPRCAPGLEALLLQSLAKRGGRATARELAEAVSVSVRTVQLTLKGLLAEGTCEVQGRGRAACYRLEDTTLWEPTLDRLRARGTESSQ